MGVAKGFPYEMMVGRRAFLLLLLPSDASMDEMKLVVSCTVCLQLPEEMDQLAEGDITFSHTNDVSCRDVAVRIHRILKFELAREVRH